MKDSPDNACQFGDTFFGYRFAIDEDLAGKSTLVRCASGIVPKLIIDNVGNIDIKKGYLVMGLIFAFIYCIPWIFVFLGTKDNNTSKIKTNISLFKGFKIVFQNRCFDIIQECFYLDKLQLTS